MLTRFRRALVAVLCLVPLGAGRPPQSGEFARFVDRYLDDFARRHPSIAAGNGIHAHDDQLDDFTAAGIRAEIAALERDRATLVAFDSSALTPDERVDRHILDGIVDGWLLEQQTLENWRRNPMVYASAITDGVHDLMTMENDSAPVRMRRVIAKLRNVPALINAARTNVVNPPRLFAERGASMMRGANDMLAKDLDVAFASVINAKLHDSLRVVSVAAQTQISAYAAYLDREALSTTGDFAIGAVNVARRYRAEELIDTPLDVMERIGERELSRLQTEFRAAAEKLAPGRDPQETWRTVRRQHPKAGQVVAATQKIVDSLAAFVSAHGIATLPRGERVVVMRALPFDLGFASMHASPPLEKKPLRSIFYIS
ncbi:MAG TPA: DUF885 family protein, partial [Gemmatimonadaceae bacterium]|nr:DUF885 family protein [Gemmatimonadaceae bacterium]